MKFQFIADHQEEYAVKRICGVLEVSECGYYAWRKRPKSERALENQELTKRIEQIYQTTYQVYGSPRIHAELQARGMGCSRKRIARLMREQGLSAASKRRRVRTTDSQPTNPVAENVLDRDFTAMEPHQKWVGDITGIPTLQGWLYLAVILDLYSRLVVGWSLSAHRDETLVECALEMALLQRHPKAGLVHHSDRGSQYTSCQYRCECLLQLP